MGTSSTRPAALTLACVSTEEAWEPPAPSNPPPPLPPPPPRVPRKHGGRPVGNTASLHADAAARHSLTPSSCTPEGSPTLWRRRSGGARGGGGVIVPPPAAPSARSVTAVGTARREGRGDGLHADGVSSREGRQRRTEGGADTGATAESSPRRPSLSPFAGPLLPRTGGGVAFIRPDTADPERKRGCHLGLPPGVGDRATAGSGGSCVTGGGASDTGVTAATTPALGVGVTADAAALIPAACSTSDGDARGGRPASRVTSPSLSDDDEDEEEQMDDEEDGKEPPPSNPAGIAASPLATRPRDMDPVRRLSSAWVVDRLPLLPPRDRRLLSPTPAMLNTGGWDKAGPLGRSRRWELENGDIPIPMPRPRAALAPARAAPVVGRESGGRVRPSKPEQRRGLERSMGTGVPGANT